jgi:hypothetical protein
VLKTKQAIQKMMQMACSGILCHDWEEKFTIVIKLYHTSNAFLAVQELGVHAKVVRNKKSANQVR